MTTSNCCYHCFQGEHARQLIPIRKCICCGVGHIAEQHWVHRTVRNKSGKRRNKKKNKKRKKKKGKEQGKKEGAGREGERKGEE